MYWVLRSDCAITVSYHEGLIIYSISSIISSLSSLAPKYSLLL